MPICEDYVSIAYKAVFLTETFWSFFAETFLSLKHFDFWLTVVLQLAITVFFSIYFQTF